MTRKIKILLNRENQSLKRLAGFATMFGFKVSQISIKCTKAERSRNLDHSKKENLKGFSIDTNKLCNKLANRHFQIGLNSFIAFRICKSKVSLR